MPKWPSLRNVGIHRREQLVKTENDRGTAVDRPMPVVACSCMAAQSSDDASSVPPL
jgi:hypothetical protein